MSAFSLAIVDVPKSKVLMIRLRIFVLVILDDEKVIFFLNSDLNIYFRMLNAMKYENSFKDLFIKVFKYKPKY